jgi:hypothetical protein
MDRYWSPFNTVMKHGDHLTYQPELICVGRSGTLPSRKSSYSMKHLYKEIFHTGVCVFRPAGFGLILVFASLVCIPKSRRGFA